jgi:hypothetical protein
MHDFEFGIDLVDLLVKPPPRSDSEQDSDEQYMPEFNVKSDFC